MAIAIDAASSELYDEERDVYYFPGESRMNGKEILRLREEMVDYYENLADRYPIVSIEDGLHEEDWCGWKLLTGRLGERIQLVGDDLFVTNTERLKRGIEQKIANAILVKVNQIGTLTEAFAAIEMAQKAGVPRCDLPPVRGNRGRGHRGYRGGGQCRADQDRGALPLRPERQI